MALIAGGAIAAARLLGVQGYGAYTTATAFIAVASAGIGAGHTERAIRSGAAPDAGEIGERATSAVRDLLRYAPIWVAILFPIALTTRVSIATTLLVAVPTAILVALSHTLEGLARGAFQHIRDLLPIQVVGPFVVLVGCAAGIMFSLDVGPAGLLGWRFVVLAVIVLYFARRLHMSRSIRGTDNGTGRPDRLRGFAAAKILFVLQLQSSILIAGFNGAESAGLYTAAFRSAEPIQAGAAAAALLVGPAAARAAQGRGVQSVHGEIRQHARLGLLVAILPTLLILAFPGFVLGLFGSSYGEVKTPLRILAIGPLVTTLFGPGMILASMAKLQREIVVAMGSAVILQFGVAGLLFAAGELTLVRVALLDVAGTVLWNVVLWRSCRRRLGMTAAVI